MMFQQCFFRVRGLAIAATTLGLFVPHLPAAAGSPSCTGSGFLESSCAPEMGVVQPAGWKRARPPEKEDTDPAPSYSPPRRGDPSTGLIRRGGVPQAAGPGQRLRARGAGVGESYPAGTALPDDMPVMTLNWRSHRLPPPGPGEIWVRAGQQVVLIDAVDRTVLADWSFAAGSVLPQNLRLVPLDWAAYGLPQPGPGEMWIHGGGKALLIDTTTRGVIAAIDR